MVERHLAKVEVAGSSPVIRSIHGHEDSCPFSFEQRRWQGSMLLNIIRNEKGFPSPSELDGAIAKR